jgi:hypothetical protein
MAVNPIEQPQAFSAAFKPSVAAADSNAYRDEFRRTLRATHVQGGRLVTYYRAPWAGVISKIQSIQQIAGGGAGGQNTVDVQVGPTVGTLASVFAAAADGNNLRDNDAAGTTQLNFPTAIAGLGILVACSDGISRTKFNKGDLIYIVSAAGAGALGTVDILVEIEKELIVRV